MAFYKQTCDCDLMVKRVSKRTPRSLNSVLISKEVRLIL